MYYKYDVNYLLCSILDYFFLPKCYWTYINETITTSIVIILS